MPIPDNIKGNHILDAIKKVDKDGYPKIHESKKYYVLFKSKTYPPKLLISYGNRFANGRELPCNEFHGGSETNNYLKDLGFTIIER